MTDKKTWEKLATGELRGKPLDALTWHTLEGRPAASGRHPRSGPLYARRQGHDVCRPPVDDPAICGVFDG